MYNTQEETPNTRKKRKKSYKIVPINPTYNQSMDLAKMCVDSFKYDKTYNKLFDGDYTLFINYFLYYFKQANIWKNLFNIDTMYIMFDDETKEYISMSFLIPPGCEWDEKLYNSYIIENKKVQQFDDFFNTFMVDIQTYYYLLFLCTNVNHQNMGYGTELLNFCLNINNIISVIVDISSDSLVDFYSKYGFIVYKQGINLSISIIILKKDYN